MAAFSSPHLSSIQLKSLQLPQKTQNLNNTLITRRCFAVSMKTSSSSTTDSVKKNYKSLIVIDSLTASLITFVSTLESWDATLKFTETMRLPWINLEDKGISVQTIQELGPTIPIFGVCLGLQCIGEAFGGKIVRSPSGAVLGKSSLVYYNDDGEEGLFAGLSNPFAAARYHRFVIDNNNFPNDDLEITAWTDDGLVMAARHRVYTHLQGVQFHPESIITKEGKNIVGNFIKLIQKMESDSQI